MEAPAPIYAKPRATGFEIAAWIVVAFAIVFAMHHHLLSAILSGLLVYSMVHRIARHLTERELARGWTMLAAVLIFSGITIVVASGIVIALIGMLKGHVGDIPEMMAKITRDVESFHDWFVSRTWIPHADTLYDHLIKVLKEHSDEWTKAGSMRGTEALESTGRMLLHAVIGIVIGTLLAFQPDHEAHGPLSGAFFERIRRFARAFEAVVFAQVKISAFNTAFTSIYLFVILPLFGIHLPFRITLVMVTFICGLIPVVGNLISNSVIVLISLGMGGHVAVASLVFLVVIHKLEYFLNAKIVGGEIHAAAWEILVAMLCCEVAFGIPGVILAPILYAYIKAELKDKQLI